MNKYLAKRIEEAHLSPKIEKLVFITAEAMRGEYPTDIFDDFMNEDVDDIIDTLGWKKTGDVRKLVESEIEEKSLAFTMMQNGRDGFLAEVNFEEMRDINFNKSGEVRSWTSGGVFYVHWIYADSIGELVEKILEQDENEYKKAIERAREDNKKS